MKRVFLAGFLATLTYAPVSACEITVQAYDQLRVGMSTNEVVEIVGCRGIVKASQEVENFRTEILAWMGSDQGSGYVDVMFQAGQLVSKTQQGLR